MSKKPDPSPSIFLAAFGKHPGWDDHIDDYGLDDERLTAEKLQLYNEGLGGNIETGSWDKLEEPARLEEFSHVLVWLAGEHVSVGRMWSSSDGKGRTKYPMVVMVHATGVAPDRLVELGVPALARIENECKDTRSADDVKAALNRARRELRGAVEGSPGTDASQWRPPGETLAGIADREELAADGQRALGMYRVLYEIEKEMDDFRPAEGRTRSNRSKPTGLRPRHIRVPAYTGDSSAKPIEATHHALLSWLGVLRAELDSSAPMLAIAPVGTSGQGMGWIDLIVGDPTAAQLFCVRAHPRTLPLTTEIPYTIEPDQITSFQVRLDEWRSNKFAREDRQSSSIARLAGAALGSSATGREQPQGVKAEETRAPTPPERSKSGVPVGILIAVVIGIAGLIVLVLAMSGGGSKDAPPAASSRTPPAEASGKIDGPVSVASSGPSAPDPAPAVTPGASGTPPAGTTSAGTTPTPPAPTTPPPAIETKTAQQDQLAAAAKLAEEEEKARVAAAVKEAEAIKERELAEARRKANEEEQARIAAAVKAADEAKAREIEEARRLAAAEAERKEREQKSAAAADATRNAVLKALDAAERQLRLGFALHEQASLPGGAQGDSLSALYSEVSVPLGGVDEQAAARIDGVTKAIDRLKQIDAASDVSEIARSAASRTLSEQRALLAKLGGSAADGTAEWLRVYTEVATAAMSALPKVDDPQRAEAIGEELRSGMKKRWGAAQAAARTPQVFDEVLGMAETCGITEAEISGLPPTSRFNIMLARVRADAASRDASAGIEPLVGFLAAVESLDGVAARPDVKPLFDSIDKARQAMETTRPGDAPPAITAEQIAKLGPGAAGWRGEADAEARAVRFFYPADAPAKVTLEFARIDRESGPVFVQTTEVSVAQFSACFAAPGRTADIFKHIKMWGKTSNDVDPREGPASWDWLSNRGIRPAVAWLRPVGLIDPIVAQNVEQGKPDDDSPIQQVPANAAMAAAKLAGCRLPTLDEWSAALGFEGGVARASANANFRDQTWDQQRLAVEQKNVEARFWPDAGAFYPAGTRRPAPGAGGLVDVNDGTLWFTPVQIGGGTRFKNLVGNVYELVLTDAASPASLVVVGGSALSPRELGVDQPLKPDAAGLRAGWADVGFRMAFSVDGVVAQDPEAARRAAWSAIDSATYILEPAAVPAR